MTYVNPVPGLVHPKGWIRPAGNTDFVIVRDCADHQATNQGCALDLGNERCDGKVFAIAAGTVRDVDPVQGIVRIVHADGSVSAYAHMVPILVVPKQVVAQGDQIGEVGDAHDPSITNFSGCHLHFAFEPVAGAGEVDPTFLLNQSGDDMPGFKIGTNIGTFKFVGAHALISPTDTKVRYMQAADAGPWDVAASLDLKTTDNPPQPVDIDGNSPPLNDRDQVYLVDAPNFGLAAYALRQDGKFTPKPTDGHSDQELMLATQNAGYNAAQEVSAAGVTALQQTAAKYPKP